MKFQELQAKESRNEDRKRRYCEINNLKLYFYVLEVLLIHIRSDEFYLKMTEASNFIENKEFYDIGEVSKWFVTKR